MGHILVVANDFPYPPHHGAAVDVWNRLLSLKRLGFDLDFVVTIKRNPERTHIRAVQAVVERLWLVRRKRGVASALTPVPFQVRSRAGLRDVPLVGEYDAVLLESEYVAPILENPGLTAGVRILRLATDEPRYFRELSKSADRWIEKCFYRTEAFKFDWFSARVKSNCDLLWFISDWERTCHIQRYPQDSLKATFLPPDPGVKKMHPHSAGGREVLFIGSLTFPPNLEGLEWYIEHIHPRLVHVQGYSLIVAGRTDGASIPGLHRILQRNPSITLCPDPQELDDLYERAAVFVNPVLRGAGVKLKTIHALHAGVPVVSTSVGMEGTGLIDGSHLLVADSAEDFARHVTTLLGDTLLGGRLVRSAQSFLAETYDHERNIKRSLDLVFSAQPR